MNVGPLVSVVKPLISTDIDTYWVHKNFMNPEFDGPSSDLNRKRLMALINEALVYNKVNYQKINTARWAADASALIYFILKHPSHSETELSDLKDRLTLFMAPNLSKTED